MGKDAADREVAGRCEKRHGFAEAGEEQGPAWGGCAQGQVPEAAGGKQRAAETRRVVDW